MGSVVHSFLWVQDHLPLPDPPPQRPPPRDGPREDAHPTGRGGRGRTVVLLCGSDQPFSWKEKWKRAESPSRPGPLLGKVGTSRCARRQPGRRVALLLPQGGCDPVLTEEETEDGGSAGGRGGGSVPEVPRGG